MIQMNRSLVATGTVLAVAVLASGCTNRTYITATGSTPPQFTHVYITTQAVWLNSSATAGPGDSGWSQYPLTTPVTIDLIAATNGTLEQIIGGLALEPGTYKQILLIPTPYSPTPSASAQAAGASYDQEVDYVDSTGTHQVPLEILNAANGIAIPGSLTVPFGDLGSSFGSSFGMGTTDTGMDTTTGTTSFFGSSSSSSTDMTSTSTSGMTDVDFTIDFNGATDIALFNYGPSNQYVGAVLNNHATAYDLTNVGGISGNLTLTVPNGYTNASSRPNITATAESLSADGTRHVVVLSAPINADGSFLLYPLPASTNTSNPTTYDVVIHGAGIQTMIIKKVQVFPSSTSSVMDNGTTTTSTTMTTTGTAIATANTSIGTFVPVAADSYTVNVAPTSASTLPAGAAVAFYQTLPGSSEVPYVIEEAAIDPINRTLVLPQPLSSGPLESGTYTTTSTATTSVTEATSSTGETITLTSASPQEGVGTYRVGGIATYYGEASLGTTVSAAASSSSSSSSSATSSSSSVAAVTVTPAALPVQSGAASDSITATVTSTPGQYNGGVLFVSQGGTIVASAPLNSVLASASGTVTITGLPGGSAGSPLGTANYYLSALVWNTNNPTQITPESFPTPVDLTQGSATGVQVTID